MVSTASDPASISSTGPPAASETIRCASSGDQSEPWWWACSGGTQSVNRAPAFPSRRTWSSRRCVEAVRFATTRIRLVSAAVLMMRSPGARAAGARHREVREAVGQVVLDVVGNRLVVRRRDHAHGQAEVLDPVRQVVVDPAGEVLGHGADDDLVEAARVDGGVDGVERIVPAV